LDWKRFFDAHAPYYDQNSFAQHTNAEVDFLLTLFPLPSGARILDIGCGTGRHSVELARRGFDVTGLDLSTGMLQIARAKAEAAGLGIHFVEGDATRFTFPQPFDAAICLCEGGFGLLGESDEPYGHATAILSCVAAALKSGGGFLLTAMNGYSAIRRFTDENTQSGAFDPASMLACYEDDWDLPEGKRTVVVRERLFIAPEIDRLLKGAGFRVEAIYGGTAGHWGRRPLMLDEVEAMFVCRKCA